MFSKLVRGWRSRPRSAVCIFVVWDYAWIAELPWVPTLWPGGWTSGAGSGGEALRTSAKNRTSAVIEHWFRIRPGGQVLERDGDRTRDPVRLRSGQALCLGRLCSAIRI